ncbi:FAD-binding oxidoreductase [Nocardioides terrisoli]|uniref:FAD-binding oxidoreductase n=1 Tax=Nocardioides terrisoli TaxID=3388267 RepID=UPI00287B894D|nr:FAD-binding oxidoreductase [Nocardioides marmorisolisilvae]
MGLRGPDQHLVAVRRLQDSYAEVPAGAPVRLRKKTSNLFRPRESAGNAGLDVSGLDGVIAIDPQARTADVQGMCTYEDLVDVTLAHGMIPKVVPQLRTITLGGAVTGLGIEATSFRSGLPHESVLEMDVFTGAGEVVTCTRANEHSDLFWTFPNSYGSLGYATRLRIELEPVPAYVALRHVAFDDATRLADAITEIVATRSWDGQRVDGLDGVAFAPGEYYLTVATFTDAGGATSDYTGQQIYFRSIQQRPTDLLTMEDYLWRWDTDWFWCSGAFGLQNPTVRRLWPRRFKRSDVYHRLVGLDTRFGIADRLDRRAGRPQRERVIQDVEVPVGRLREFLDWFDAEVGMRPVWLCPLVARDPWPSYPLRPDETYVNAGFWGTVHVGPSAAEAPTNRAIEAKVHDLDGHKSLYSEAFYDAHTFDALYNGAHLAAVKKRYDPEDRLITLYDKAVRRR